MNMLAPVRTRIGVEVIFDFVCPWCCLGIETAVAAFRDRQDVEVTFRWRPFILNPTIPPGGTDFATWLRGRHGGEERAGRFLRLIEAQGRELGKILHFDRIRQVPPTMDAHRLVAWASSRGDCTGLVLGIFDAYFRNGSDIGNPVILAYIAEQHGFDPELALHFLTGRTLIGTVTSDQLSAQRAGINGVPSIIIDGLAMTGVHDARVLCRLLDAALAAMPAAGMDARETWSAGPGPFQAV
ncbi:DsbA family oxidoreductase [Acetobacter musti]|uniref:DsbA family oxidoreductase n=1 Tax=Acetobacter musti TaxID=864732 RepID=A0ABX0JJ94_9PROT|nr:DsbA family oxidoreductase [Acetobacter musti]NHN83701.1 DsbA family oxidoreductase [Acetobacter musti]